MSGVLGLARGGRRYRARAGFVSAAANCGFGTNVMSANLTLDIPPLQVAGPYASTMTITAVVTGPANEYCVPIGVSI
jgi:hypothetical protein